MSASRKKMLRREENMAAMTERQQKELKDAKQLKLYTVLFTIAIIAMVVVFAVTTVFNSGILQRSTTALTVNDNKVSAVELNYFYIDSVNNFVNTYSSYISLMGLDTTQALDDQFYDEEAGTTWADYFLEQAISTAKSSYAIYDEAKANGFELDQDSLDEIELSMVNMTSYASLYGYTSADSYLEAIYGNGASTKTLENYLKVQYTADAYYNQVLAGLEYTDEELRAVDAEDPSAYNSYNYNYYYLGASSFYEGGTEDEEGNVTYSDEEKEAGRAACKEAADTLAASTTLEELETAIDALAINAEKTVNTTAVTNRLSTQVDSEMQEWITDSARQTGDITSIPMESTTTAEDGTETSVVSGYYLVCFGSTNDNNQHLVDVRHILIGFEGGTTDETTGVTTYSDEEKAAAQETAQALLDEFLAGEATEEAFATLANENSTDTGSNTTGGLYEDVYPGQTVTNFNNWCFDESRQPGDTGIVETDYGYHVMYFVETTDTTYRDYMIANTLRSEDISEWQTAVIENAVLTEKNTSFVRTDLLLPSAS